MNKKWRDFHLVKASPWPLCIRVSLINLIISLFINLNKKYEIHILYVFMSLLIIFIIFYTWISDVIRESTFTGLHTFKVKNLLKIGIVLFITSEVIFFLSFFWTFFHSSLNPALEVGNMWPPTGITSINPFHIPLLNTLILVSSGVRITFSHHALINKNYDYCTIWLLITALLGIYFSVLQFYEYLFAPFSFMDSVYGSIFFIATGFHGLHVIVGTIFILVTLSRLISKHFSSSQNLGFEFSCWYWHFVDLVWLFLYIFIYWWGF